MLLKLNDLIDVLNYDQERILLSELNRSYGKLNSHSVFIVLIVIKIFKNLILAIDNQVDVCFKV